MTHADPFILQALVCHVRLTPGPRARRRRWFARWRRTLISQGLVGRVSAGCALVLGRKRNLRPTDRHQVVNWLIDQPEVDQITLMPLVPWVDYVAGRTEPALDPLTSSPAQIEAFAAGWPQLLAQVERHWCDLDARLDVVRYFGLADPERSQEGGRHAVE